MMDKTGIPAAGNDADVAAAKRMLLDIRERLDSVTCDVISLVKAMDWIPGAVSELAAELLDDEQYAESLAGTPIWEAPRTANLLTAAVADGDQAEAEALWKPLDVSAQGGLLLALAAQLKVNLRQAFSATGTGSTSRYAIAGALAKMNVDAAAVQHIPQSIFAEMCRKTAGRSAA
jgi:hypothetical protein